MESKKVFFVAHMENDSSFQGSIFHRTMIMDDYGRKSIPEYPMFW